MERISNLQRHYAFLGYILDSKSKIARVSQEISSGCKVIYGSDDPGAAGMISSIQSKLERLDKHKQRIANGLSYLDMQDKLLGETTEVLIRTTELATQAANETLTAAQRAIIGEEVLGLKYNLINLINQQYVHSQIYGGAASDKMPIVVADPVTGGYLDPGDATGLSTRYVFAMYPGSDITNSIYITDTEQVRLNTPAYQVYGEALDALERLGRVLKGYEVTPPPPATPDGGGNAYTPDILGYKQQTADILECIDMLNSARVGQVENERTSVGVRMNQLLRARDIVEIFKIDLDTARAEMQDVDLFQAATDFTNLQISMEALLQMTGTVNKLSLMNFL